MMRRLGAPSVSPDGRYAVFSLSTTDLAANKRNNVVHILDLKAKGAAPQPLAGATQGAHDAAFGADGAIWYLAPVNGQDQLFRMAKVGTPVASETVPPSSAQIVAGGVTIAFPLEGAIDLEAEKARLSKGISAAEKERDSLAARLANPAFAERAKPEAVEKARGDHEAKAGEAERLRAALERLG